MSKAQPDDVDTVRVSEGSMDAAFSEIAKTIDCDAIQTRQLHNGTIPSEGGVSFEKLEYFVQSFPRVQIAGISDGPPEFMIGDTLGEGGMGVVRLAQQLSIDRPVAIKMARGDEAHPSQIVSLLREAWLTGALEHPNIVPVYVLGRDAKDLPVFIMKRIEGVSWKQLLEEPDHPLMSQTGQDLLARHIEIFMRVCEAVHFAHSKGIVHRDIKPSNVMIGSFGEVYLLDWGIAVSLQSDAGGRFPLARDVNGIAGTPDYMAPEMVEGTGEHVDQRTDVYLLGAVLCEILTGQPPHRGKTLMETLKKAFSAQVPAFPKGVPREILEICVKALSRDPGERYASAEELRRAVAGFLTHRSSLALTHEAMAKLSELLHLLESSGSADLEGNRQKIYRVFGEARFGFAQSLKIWGGNTQAKAGLGDVLSRMVSYEISLERSDAAEALLAEMPERNPELEKALADLRTKLAAEEREIEDLRKMHSEIDINVAFRTRGKFAITFAILFPLIEFPLGTLQRSGALKTLYPWCILSLILYMAACNFFVLGWMRSLLQNAVNRRVILTMNLAFLSSIVIMVFGAATGIPFNLAVSFEMLGFAVILAVLGFFVERRLLIGSAIYLALFTGPAIFETYAHEFVGTANMMVFSTIALIWWPFRKAQDVSSA
ncbi:MAG: serine/threonine protein kinase [Bradymonadales bacterium]|nr:serine/threonine protein kinase [Bradymonadales bacterium]